jgi:hypothetical protein
MHWENKMEEITRGFAFLGIKFPSRSPLIALELFYAAELANKAEIIEHARVG